MLDANRIEKLLSVFTQLSHCKKVKDMIKLLLDEMKNLVTFAKCTFFVFSADLREQCDKYTDQDGLYVFKTFIEGGSACSGVQKSES